MRDMRRKLVKNRDAAFGRTYPSENLTPPKLASILRELDGGHCRNAMDFFDEMEEKDLHLAAVMQTRVIAAASRQRRVIPAGDGAEQRRHADFVKEVWEGLTGKARLLHHLLSAIGRGFAVAEIRYTVAEGLLVAEEIANCPHSLFSFADAETGEVVSGFPFYLGPGETRGVRLPREKFIFHTHGYSPAGPVRGGIYRGLAWYYLFTSFSIKDWMSFMDLYGIPLRLGKFKAGSDERSREVLKEAVRNLGSDAAAVISEDTTIEFIESRLGGSHDLFRNAVEFFNRQKSKRVLGQTLTMEHGNSGSYALGNVHERVRHDITRLDSIFLDETLGRDLAVPLVKANFGPQRKYPLFVSDTESAEERAARMEGLKTLHSMGVPLSLSGIYGAAGVPEPSRGEAALSGAGSDAPSRIRNRD